MNKRKIITTGLIILFSIIFLDQVTKAIFMNKNITIIHNLLCIEYTQNTGIAFNIGSNNVVMIIIINIMILGLIIKFIKGNNLHIGTLISLFFVLAGGTSNLIDRIFRGFVIDFIDVNILNFPNFNIADICIVLGIIFLIGIIIKSIICGKKK